MTPLPPPVILLLNCARGGGDAAPPPSSSARAVVQGWWLLTVPPSREVGGGRNIWRSGVTAASSSSSSSLVSAADMSVVRRWGKGSGRGWTAALRRWRAHGDCAERFEEEGRNTPALLAPLSSGNAATAAAAAAAAPCRSGTSTVNVEPTPSLETNVSLPRMPSARSFASARPMPAPSV